MGVGVGAVVAVAVGDAVEVGVGEGVWVIVAVGVGEGTVVGVEEAVIEGDGVAVMVVEAVAVDVGAAFPSPGLGDAIATQSAAISLSCDGATRASEYPFGAVAHEGLKAVVSLP